MKKHCMILFEDLFIIPKRNGLFKNNTDEGETVKIIKMGDLFAYPILDGENIEESINVSEKEFNTFSVKENDLIFSRTSLKRDGVGKCIIVQNLKEKAIFESNLIRIRLNEKIADPWFYFYLFNSPFGRHFIDGIIQQVAAASIRGSDLEKLTVLHPSLEYQQKISEILKTIDAKISIAASLTFSFELLTLFISDSRVGSPID